MKWLINSRNDLVGEALTGLVLAGDTPPLALLDGFPDYKVLVRADWAKDRVALISGGGSGHEPAHAGFVGEGMLTAAVVGEVFASPSVDAVLRAILAVTGEAGCLLIVKNYTGDRLNFGLAAEKAKALGLKVRMVIVADDIALPQNPQPRGVAGTLFVHKIAGAAAAAGASLDEVEALARSVAGSVASLGLAFDTCSIPGTPKERRLEEGEFELGLGIHGEPGVHRLPMKGADALLADLAAEVMRAPSVGADTRFAVLINNLGGLTPIEMSLAVAALAKTPVWGRTDLVIGPLPLMTSLDMRGLSLSILALSGRFAELLRAPAAPPAWPAAAVPGKVAILPPSDRLPRAKAWQPSQNGAVRDLLLSGLTALEAAEAELNGLDALVGDGDTGSTLASAARHIRQAEQSLPYGDLPALWGALGELVSGTMGGSSGVLLAIFFQAAAQAGGDGAAAPDALLAGLAAMKTYGGADLGHRTLIDALEPALTALASGAPPAQVAQAAERGAAATKAMTSARSGRSSYVGSDRLKGHADPGAQAVAILFAALARQHGGGVRR